ncbi:MAG TPA: phosphoribosylglycinamide synthetase C domain-containing protein [Gemmatimonadaceae bacterium]|nr:phosphoribosylglycinamide synthetase C domain-containing protein [Gemmatimonadaceae bacterium]
MRFLGIGETNDLGDMYLRLIRAGHQVRVFVADESSRDVMNRMLDFTNDWRAELSWIREAGDEGIILFESASAGETQDELRNEGLNVIGGSALGDRLEQERGYAQQVLRDLGLQTAWTREFTTFDDGIAFVTASPGRYVFKLNGANWPSTRNYVGQMQSGADMLALLRVTRDNWDLAEIPSFVLMEHITGVEVGVGAFFNGESFLGTPNLDWEHKRFFPGDLGELTGEMGTIVTYRGGERLFDATLAHLAPMLRDSGYVGYINLNTIVNEAGVWPLELTCRFGYPGFAILDSLHAEEWGSIFATLIRRDRQVIETRSGFSAGVVLTVPTFPYSDGYSDVGCGTPICFTETMTEADRDALHLGEVTTAGDQLMTAGVIGYIMVVTGVGDTVEEACRTAYETAEKVIIPNVRYRNDIGARLIREDYAAMKSLGWLD